MLGLAQALLPVPSLAPTHRDVHFAAVPSSPERFQGAEPALPTLETGLCLAAWMWSSSTA